MNLQTLSGPKLEALIDRRSAAASQATQAAIAAGLGNVRFDAMRERAAAGDQVAVAVVATWDAEREARCELDARRRYHGTTRPIRSR